MDAQQLVQAADAIRESLGARFEDSYDDGVMRMRGALQSALGADEAQADRLVKTLVNNRLAIYHSAREADQQIGPDIRDMPEADTAYDGVDDQAMNRVAPTGYTTSVGLVGQGNQYIAPTADPELTNTRSDSYIDRQLVGVQELGEADAFGEGGYWEIPEIASGTVTQPGGTTGPDYAQGRTSGDV